MKNQNIKRYRLNYKIADIRIREAVKKVIQSGQEPTVKLVAKEAGVSVSTAYSHKCQDMILDVLFEK